MAELAKGEMPQTEILKDGETVHVRLLVEDELPPRWCDFYNEAAKGAGLSAVASTEEVERRPNGVLVSRIVVEIDLGPELNHNAVGSILDAVANVAKNLRLPDASSNAVQRQGAVDLWWQGYKAHGSSSSLYD